VTDLSTPAIGRKLARLFATDRAAAVAILAGTHSIYWEALALSYLAALGIDEGSRATIVPGVLYVWQQLVKETTPLCTSTHYPPTEPTEPTD
jgi:hypothetical protein